MVVGPPFRPQRITVARHGATEWSSVGRHTGKSDLPLSKDGETEAKRLGTRLDHLRPALVLSSPLRRAIDTCVLAGFGDGVETSDLLVEMDYGDYDGLTTLEIREERPGWDLFRDGCPGGETIEEVAARAAAVLSRLSADTDLDGEDVLIFAHGHLLRSLAATWLGLAPPEARHFVLGSGSVGQLSWEREWRTMSEWNLR